MKARLVKRTGESRELSLVFSWGYFFFGPLYYFFNKLIFRGFLLLLLYVFAIWKNSGSLLVEGLVKLGVNAKYVNFLEFPGKYYFITLGVLIGLHVVLCFITPKAVVKKLLQKRGYVPYSEIDAQLLVKYSLAKVGTKCYLSNYKPINGVQGKIKIQNTEELSKKLDELAQLLKEGMITKDEYNTKRAEALMNVASKK
jgi:hypothetical protein